MHVQTNELLVQRAQLLSKAEQERHEFTNQIDSLVLQLAMSRCSKEQDQREIKRVRGQLDAVLAQNKLVKDDIERCMNEEHNKDRQMSLLIERVKESKNLNDRQRRDFEERSEENINEIKRWKSLYEESQKDLRSETQRSLEFQNKCNQLEQKCGNFEKENETLKKQLAKESSDRHESVQMFEVEKDKNKMLSAELESQSKSWNDKLQAFEILLQKRRDRIDNLVKEKQQREQEVSQKDEQLRTARLDLEEVTQQISRLSEQIAGLSAEREGKKSKLEEKCAKLSAMHKVSTREMTLLRDNYDRALCRLGVVARELHSLNGDLLSIRKLKFKRAAPGSSRPVAVYDERGMPVDFSGQIQGIRVTIKNIIGQCLSNTAKLTTGASVHDPQSSSKPLRPLSATAYYQMFGDYFERGEPAPKIQSDSSRYGFERIEPVGQHSDDDDSNPYPSVAEGGR